MKRLGWLWFFVACMMFVFLVVASQRACCDPLPDDHVINQYVVCYGKADVARLVNKAAILLQWKREGYDLYVLFVFSAKTGYWQAGYELRVSTGDVTHIKEVRYVHSRI